MQVGFDAGTYNLVAVYRDKEGNFVYKREVNAFLKMPIENDYVFNMMKSHNVPLIKRGSEGIAYALGEAAINFAATMPGVELSRPMKDGCLNPREKDAQNILYSMVNGLLDEVDPGSTLYYSVPANAINEETDADYHTQVLSSIFRGVSNEDGESLQLNAQPINEGLALVYAELQSKMSTGIGISFGAGMVNLCYAMYGAPIFQFSIVNSGDWIDKMSAKATGESVAFINREKTKVNLNEDSTSLVQNAIKAQYQIMIQKTVTGIKKGIQDAGNKVRSEHPIDIVISGGTSSPPGFDTMFEKTLREAKLPIEIGSVIRPKDPLYSVARGCLLAAEAADQ